MGLDMYLKASKRMPAEVAALMEKSDPDRYPYYYNSRANRTSRKFATLTAEAAYWRKANIIHGWFVRNVQGGEDECRPHTVSKEQLIQLIESCQAVLDGDSPEHHDLLPTNGFFFGPTGDEAWNREQLQTTAEMLSRTLKEYPGWKYTYQSSW